MTFNGTIRVIVSCTLLGSVAGLVACQKELVVAEGKKVSLEYTLKLEDGSVKDSNVGQAPLVFTQGSGQIIPGLERELVGLKIGDTKEVVVQPEDGYGLARREAIRELPLDEIPEEARHPGAELHGMDPASGRPIKAIVVEVKEKTAMVDFNHELAGKILFFTVKVLDIEEGDSE